MGEKKKTRRLRVALAFGGLCVSEEKHAKSTEKEEKEPKKRPASSD